MTRQRRWHGDPDEPEQPDVGDVIAHVHRTSGLYEGGLIYRVLATRPIRGREAEPWELMLTIEPGTAADLWPAGGPPAGGGTVFLAHRCGSRCRCGRR